MQALGNTLSPDVAIWVARGLVALHAIVVGITVAGGIAVLRGRFRQVDAKDLFAWAFLFCCVGQLLSIVATGHCIFTTWEKQLLTIAGEEHTYAGTFVQRLIPWLPDSVAHKGVPLLTLGALIGALVQIVPILKRRHARQHERTRDETR